MGTAEAGGRDGFGSFEGAQERGGIMETLDTRRAQGSRSKAVSGFFSLEQAKVVENSTVSG